MVSMFEQQVRLMQDRLEALPPRSIAIFSAACAERLTEYYEHFASLHGWNSYPAVRRILNLCWDILLGDDSLKDDLERYSADLLKYVPHADDFAGPLCTGAQDFAACIEYAAKWILANPTARYGVSYYAVEVLYQEAMQNQSGRALSHDEIVAKEGYIMNDPAIRKEFALQADDLSVLEVKRTVASQDIAAIRSRAIASRHRRKE